MEKTFAEKLKQIKNDAGLTQEEVAALLGVSKRAVEEWERGAGKPKPYLQSLILEVLESRVKKGVGTKKQRIAYPITITRDGDFYIVYIPDFDINTQGESIADAMYMARDAIEIVCNCLRDDGQHIPEPSSLKDITADADALLTLVDVSVWTA